MSRILVTHPSADLYGSDRMVVETTSALIASGHTVSVVLPSDGPLVTLFEQLQTIPTIEPIQVLRKSMLRPHSALRSIGGFLLGVWRARRFIQSAKPDVVLCNTITQPHWILAGKMCHVRLICHVREIEVEAHRVVQRTLALPLRFCDLVLTNSLASRTWISRVGGVSDPNRIRVVYNGKRWPSHGIRRRTPGAQEPARITVIGRLSPRKGQDLAILALRKLLNDGLSVELILAGDAFQGYEWYAEHLRELANQLGVTKRVAFPGFVDDLTELLRGTDVAVVPSRQEPFGTVAAEALAAHVPTVAADVQGLKEIVVHGETGLLFQPGDAEDLAECLRVLLTNMTLAQELADRGSLDVRERFTLARYRAAIDEAVNEVLGGRVGQT